VVALGKCADRTQESRYKATEASQVTLRPQHKILSQTVMRLRPEHCMPPSLMPSSLERNISVCLWVIKGGGVMGSVDEVAVGLAEVTLLRNSESFVGEEYEKQRETVVD